MNIKYLKTVLSISSLALLASCQAGIDADYLIENGQVFVGDNTPAKNLVIAIKNDQIVYAGKPGRKINAVSRIDATGLYVIAGFIDPHTHSMGELTSDDPEIRENRNYQFQGVTTVVNGNDGFGSPDIESEMAELSAVGIGTNTALFIGHGALRKSIVGGDKRPPSDTEMVAMKEQMHLGMKAGALGLSTGLFYAPGSFSNTDEVIELARVAGEYNGVYDSHIRDESTYNIGLEAAVDEVIQIAREAKVHGHIAHIKALGVDVWGKSDSLIERIEQARSEGLNITADQYPWRASGTRISNALIPRWVKAGTPEDYMDRLDDLDLRPKIVEETAENLRKRGGPEAVLITQKNPEWQGKTLGELARANDKSPVEMAISIALAGDARIASFNMSPNDIKNFMKKPWVMTSSDGSIGHPRKYASYPQKFQKYVVEKSIMPVETFFYRSSGLVAENFGICDRGYLRAGYKADIAVIDPKTYRPNANFQNPEVLTTGVEYLFVNGTAAIADGNRKSELAGKVIRRCTEKTNAQ